MGNMMMMMTLRMNRLRQQSPAQAAGPQPTKAICDAAAAYHPQQCQQRSERLLLVLCGH
jgi:hypothetical protein